MGASCGFFSGVVLRRADLLFAGLGWFISVASFDAGSGSSGAV